MTISTQIKKARVARRLSQTRLADLSKVDRQTVARLEAGAGTLAGLSPVLERLGLAFCPRGTQVGDIVRTRRKELGISLDTVGKESGLSKTTVINLEKSVGRVSSLIAVGQRLELGLKLHSMNSVRLMLGDCLTEMASIPTGSVDLVICDPPYGTTAYEWDRVIPFDALWPGLKRVLTSTGVVVFTATYPFSGALMMSNPDWFKFTMVWQKSRATGHVHAKHMPLRAHEDILVFSPGVIVGKHRSSRQFTYNPQGVTELDIPRSPRSIRVPGYLRSQTANRKAQTHENFPTSIIRIPSELKQLVPTQKPVALIEYLIATFSNAGDTVLDPTMGSGTSGVSAVALGRRFIGIEKHPDHFGIASDRLHGDRTARRASAC